MTKHMLIDASHPEETRVVVVDDNRLEEFDFESSTKKQLKGNIYLAKVTRVEPSLQAAFVDYGGQRHGFLAFSEIHPDYYQIPRADRKLLDEPEPVEADQAETNGAEPTAEAGPVDDVTTDQEEEAAEVFDEQARRRSRLLRSYKIQEVIKRRQIMLVQVVKEERGNKGAALTTYISLAGRYSVLMPNTARGGGISRKIANPTDRSRLKTMVREIEVPDGMGLIIRTAGQQRSKMEIRRDYEYSLRLWNDIRERTLESIAPCVIYEEGALVKRAVRDLYTRDIDEVLVEGEEGYRSAKKVMTMLMPSRARRVKVYKEELPLFHHFAVEEQLDALHNPNVQLRSGGSIVIHTTEALTAIDVNSGRSTRERNIEETALKTNVEAAVEIARQLRLRDIAGLVVIDFIDMVEGRNQRAVERKLRDALKTDRARVQLGRISAFGLLELSRQRLRPSFQELSSEPCPTCGGVGTIRSVESAALQALRAIEFEGLRGTAAALKVTLPMPVALYTLNQKRDRLVALEERYGMSLDLQVDEDLITSQVELDVVETKPQADRRVAVEVTAATESPQATESRPDGPEATDEEDGGRKRRRRRRRRRKTDGGVDADMKAPGFATAPPDVDEGTRRSEDVPAEEEPASPQVVAEAVMAEAVAEGEPTKRPRRRRRRTADPAPAEAAALVEPSASVDVAAPAEAAVAEVAAVENGAVATGPAVDSSSTEEVVPPKRPRRRRRRAVEPKSAEAEPVPAAPDTPVSPAIPATAAETAPGLAEHEGGPDHETAGPRSAVTSGAPSPASDVELPLAAAPEALGESDALAEEPPFSVGEAPSDSEDGASNSPARRGWWSRFVRKDD